MTLASSRKMSVPRKRPSRRSCTCRSLVSTSAPSRRSACRWVSMRRRPMRSPPGRGSTALPVRCSRPGASRNEPRMSAPSSELGVRSESSSVSRSMVCRSSESVARTPTSPSISSWVSTSRMPGTFSMRWRPEPSSEAASTGRASFLLPAGSSLPSMGRPPSTTNRSPVPACSTIPPLRTRLGDVASSRPPTGYSSETGPASSSRMRRGSKPRTRRSPITTTGIARVPVKANSRRWCCGSAWMSRFS